jgi:hypothetical protein
MQTEQLQLTADAFQASKAHAVEQAALLQWQLSSTPSPNQNTPSPERPQDIAYKQALETQAAAEPALTDAQTADQKQIIQFAYIRKAPLPFRRWSNSTLTSVSPDTLNTSTILSPLGE